MLFNSFAYAAFFLVVLTVYWRVRSDRGRLWVLLVASLFFYGSWSPLFLGLLFVTISIDFWVGRRIYELGENRRKKTLYLLVSLCGNLGILAVFKYSDFFVENLAGLLRLVGVSDWHPRPLGIVLPLGISFYTFLSLGYIIDIYRRDVRPIDSFLVFSVFVMFFPHLIAGPILRAKEFSPQLQTPRWVDNERIVRGISRIAIGLTKKVLIADWLASIVEPVFANPAYFDGRAHLVALYAYAFQILFDFAGYCDIAIGCALLLGYELPENFNSPYLSRSVTEFWRRWHMTLSTWLRDYLYISLGGNRFGAWSMGVRVSGILDHSDRLRA